MIGLDGVNLGPITVSWSALTVIAGLLTWFAVARFAHAERAAVVTLLVARVWDAVPGLDASRPLLQNVLDLVDVRRGGWAWIPGVIAGLLALWWPTRRFPARLPAALLPTLLAAALPLLLKPAPQGLQATLPTTPLLTLDAATPTPVRTGYVVNFWATWCGPCRAELPLLAHAQAQGDHIELVNVGEDAQTVGRFLRDTAPTLTTRLGGEAISGPLGITGFPTTLAVNTAGQIVARHLGPLSGAQLRTLLEQAKGTP